MSKRNYGEFSLSKSLKAIGIYSLLLILILLPLLHMYGLVVTEFRSVLHTLLLPLICIGVTFTTSRYAVMFAKLDDVRLFRLLSVIVGIVISVVVLMMLEYLESGSINFITTINSPRNAIIPLGKNDEVDITLPFIFNYVFALLIIVSISYPRGKKRFKNNVKVKYFRSVIKRKADDYQTLKDNFIEFDEKDRCLFFDQNVHVCIFIDDYNYVIKRFKKLRTELIYDEFYIYTKSIHEIK